VAAGVAGISSKYLKKMTNTDGRVCVEFRQNLTFCINFFSSLYNSLILRLIVILKLSTNSSPLNIQFLIYVLEQNEHSPEFLSSQAYNKLFLTR
jgi:hypothetical protein